MKLVLIPNEVCPHCGAGVVAESCRNRHVNGQGFETREFACRLILEWIPNYGKLVEKQPCPNSQVEKDKEAKRDQAKEALIELLRDFDVDRDFKKGVLWRGLSMMDYQIDEALKEIPEWQKT